MAAHGESDTGVRFQRFLFGLASAAVAAFHAGGGWDHALFAGFFAGAALFLLRPSSEGGRQAVNFAVDFAAVATFAALCDPSGALWRAPETMEQLFRFSSAGAGVATGIYVVGVISLTARSRLPLRIALFLLPFLFSLLIALGSPPVTQIGGVFFLGFDAPETLKKIAGRTFVLLLLNEAVIVGVPLALGRFLPREWRPHGILALSAFLASLTPFVASSVVFIAPYAPAPVAALLAAIASALAQAGLWGQTYLVTQALAGLLRAAPSLSVVVFHDWKTGAEKGAVYGFVYIGLLLAVALVVSFPPAMTLITLSGPIAGAALGAALFPLARTIMESTDSTPPFFGRLEEAYLRPVNYARGAVTGVAASVALMIGLPAASASDRFLFGALAGALAYAGVDIAHDSIELTRGRRQHYRSWRVYTLAALLGGFVAGGIFWYLDADQIATVTRKFFAYTTLDYAVEGRGPIPYTLRPLFSKWGASDLGLVDGGVRLLYDESLSGVIQWVFAAPLFSINFFFLTALITRSLHPLRQLASWEGIDMLITNAVHVLRWGLWMAPVIYSFLKAAPDPAWYNQDGLIRTAVATWMSYILPDNEFRAWSLDIFTAILAFDALRVLIWFDHMGMRVATLVNLSFVGGDMLDEQAARFVGKEQMSRAIPRGHPPFRHMGAAAFALLPSARRRVGQGLDGGGADDHDAAALLYVSCRRLPRLCRPRRAGSRSLPARAPGAGAEDPARRHHRRGRRAWVAALEAHQRPDDERMVSGRAGGDPHRGRRPRRSADRPHAPPRRSRPSARPLPLPARGGRRIMVRGRGADALPRGLRQTLRCGRKLPLLHGGAERLRHRSHRISLPRRGGRGPAPQDRQSRAAPAQADALLAARMGAERDGRRNARRRL